MISFLILSPFRRGLSRGRARAPTGYLLFEKDLRILDFVFFLVGNFVRLDYQLTLVAEPRSGSLPAHTFIGTINLLFLLYG